MGVGAIIITLRGVPKGKGRPRFSRDRGVPYTPGDTRRAEENVEAAGARAMDGRPPLDLPVILDALAIFPIPMSWSKKKKARAAENLIRPTGKPDGDNILKLIGDGLNGIVWRDDSQIIDARIRKLYGATPGLSIKVTPLDLGERAA